VAIPRTCKTYCETEALNTDYYPASTTEKTIKLSNPNPEEFSQKSQKSGVLLDQLFVPAPLQPNHTNHHKLTSSKPPQKAKTPCKNATPPALKKATEYIVKDPDP
jgi:hypothetical protein